MTLIEAGLVVWIVMIGLLVASGFWPYGVAGLALISPAIGSATYGLSGLVLVSTGRFSTVGSLLLASTAALGSLVWGRSRRSSVPMSTIVWAGAYALVGVAIVSMVVVTGSFTRLTPDSMAYLTLSGELERFGMLRDLSESIALKRQFMMAALQAGGVVSGRGYLVTLFPVVVTSGLGFMAWLATEALRSRGVRVRTIGIAVALVVLFLVTANRVVYNMFYINGHGLFAAMLVVAVGMFWLMAMTRTWAPSVLVGLAAATMVPLRAEALIVLVLFLLPGLVSKAVPNLAKWLIVIPVAATTLLWYGYTLRQMLPARSFGLSSTATMSILLAFGLVVVVALGHIAGSQRVLRLLPAIVFGVLVAYTAVQIVRQPVLARFSIEAIGANIGGEGGWSSFWWIAPGAVAVGVAVTRIAHQEQILWGLAAYPVALLAFAFLRGGAYRVGEGDSANRMLMHIVFIVGLYLIVAVGHLASASKVTDGR